MLQQLKDYQSKYNTLNFPPPEKGSWTRYYPLNEWVEAQRRSYSAKTMEEARIKELSNLGFEFNRWDVLFKKLKKYKKEAGTARIPMEYKVIKIAGEKDGELEELCRWVNEQIRLYRKDELDSDKKKKLRKLGVYLTKTRMGKVSWETRFEEMMEYYHDNKTVLPKRDGE